MHYFAVYSGHEKARGGHVCIARAADKVCAVKAARSSGLSLLARAYAMPLTVQQYAEILRGCGLKVSGVPEQMQLMECAN